MEDNRTIEYNGTWYAISEMEIHDLYKVLCRELSFNNMIELYRLIQHKMTYLDDKVVDKCEVMRNEKNIK